MNNDAALQHMAKASAELSLLYQMIRLAREHLKSAHRELKSANEVSTNKDCPTYKRLSASITAEIERLNLEIAVVEGILAREPLAKLVLEGSRYIKDVFV